MFSDFFFGVAYNVKLTYNSFQIPSSACGIEGFLVKPMLAHSDLCFNLIILQSVFDWFTREIFLHEGIFC